MGKVNNILEGVDKVDNIVGGYMVGMDGIMIPMLGVCESWCGNKKSKEMSLELDKIDARVK